MDLSRLNPAQREAYLLLKKHESVRREIQQRWTHILVDEYQDTNRVQYELLRQLFTEDHSLTVVGDDDQSIYRWRGADIVNILRFENDFPNAEVVRLEQNYRSTAVILAAANAVISNNVGRKGKNLFTTGDEGRNIGLRVFSTERDEGEAVGDGVRSALDKGCDAFDIGVLYRTNAQSRAIEDALRRRRIGYAVYGGVRFYDRREVRDALAYLRLINNPRGDVDFTRIVNTPARGIGKTSVDRIIKLGNRDGVPAYEAARRAADGAIKNDPPASYPWRDATRVPRSCAR